MWDKNLPNNAQSFSAPFRVSPSFTPQTRTPWGGRRIAQMRGLAPQVIGEAWEVSSDERFPSRVEGGATLRSVLDAQPALLGERDGLQLLVKVLDAAAPLSVQIHPSDDDPALASDESGKPELWYVTAHEPGACLFIGLAPGADESTMRAALAADAGVDALLNRVEVSVGDVFVVPPGTPHALGAGVTLVEPQRVQDGRRGLTYRYWDWGRRFDEKGEPDPEGKPRELHVERAIAVTDWDAARGEAGLVSLRLKDERKPGARRLCGPAGEDGALPFPWLELHRWQGPCEVEVDAARHLRALHVCEGEVHFGDRVARAHESWIVPAGISSKARVQGTALLTHVC